MNLIVFSEGQKIKRQLIGAVEGAGIAGAFEICSTCETLYQRLRQPSLSQMVAILSMAQRRTLSALLTEKKLIQEIKTIFILPDDQMETIVLAHLFHPRFVFFKEDISVKLPLVLLKMNDEIALIHKSNADRLERLKL